MKKFIILPIIFCIILLGSLRVYSIQTPNVEEQKEVNKNMLANIKNYNEDDLLNLLEKFNKLGNRYINNVRTCEKVHFNEELDFFGLKFSLKADINGWVDKKCSYELSANFGGFGKDIHAIFDIPVKDSTIEKFKPGVKCNFTQKDLNLIAKILSKKHTENIAIYKKMIKESNFDLKKNENNDENKEIKLTADEQKLLTILTDGKTCEIPNLGEIMVNFMEIKKELDDN